MPMTSLADASSPELVEVSEEMEVDQSHILREVFGDSSSDDEQEEEEEIPLDNILKEVFGDSSNDDDDEEEEEKVVVSVKYPYKEIRNPRHRWEQVKEIKGLWLCKHFLSHDEQALLLSQIKNEGWFGEASKNQVMRFGDLPEWAIDLSANIRETIGSSEYTSEIESVETLGQDIDGHCPLPSNLLFRLPLFDQLIANIYQPGEGICAHVDLMRFEDGIAIISLESECVMHFSRAEGEASDSVETAKIPVLLVPGSLVVMHGEARYLWKHEINRKAGFQVLNGREICQQRRISITLRKLCRTT